MLLFTFSTFPRLALPLQSRPIRGKARTFPAFGNRAELRDVTEVWKTKNSFLEFAFKFQVSFEKHELPLLLSPSFLRQHGQCSEEV